MKITFLEWENFGTEDMIRAFINEGHEVARLKTGQEELLSPAITGKMSRAVKENGSDIVFSFNYFPYVAEAAKDEGFAYYSWVYDNPCVQLYSCTALYPTNHIYVFDSDTYLKFHDGGIDTVNFLPMAADPDRLEELVNGRFESDISFVGSLYDEEHDFYSRMMEKGISARTEGYLRGIMEAQKLLYGMSIIEMQLTDDIIEDMYKALPLNPAQGSAITKQTLFAEYVINRRITAEERRDILKRLGNLPYRTSVYTRNGASVIPGCDIHGPVDFYEEAPKIFHRSKINLNISLRSIVNGIPLRCFDIMGAGGFLLTSYAGDMPMFFNDGEHFVSFSDPDDCVAKCRYYLTHADERVQIAAAGLEEIRASHTFAHRVREMLG